MTIYKWALFEKTSSPIWLKMAQMMLKGPLKMSYKSGLGHPLKIFHGSKIEIFGPSQSSTGAVPCEKDKFFSSPMSIIWAIFSKIRDDVFSKSAHLCKVIIAFFAHFELIMGHLST